MKLSTIERSITVLGALNMDLIMDLKRPAKPGETIVRNGVKIIGASNLPCSIPNHASSLYSRNLLSLLQPMFKEGKFLIDNDDELIAGSLISKDGVILKSEIIENGGTRS